VDFRRGHGLVEEAIDDAALLDDVRAHELERDRRLAQDVVGAQHRAHGSRAEDLLDLVFLIEDLARVGVGGLSLGRHGARHRSRAYIVLGRRSSPFGGRGRWPRSWPRLEALGKLTPCAWGSISARRGRWWPSAIEAIFPSSAF